MFITFLVLKRIFREKRKPFSFARFSLETLFETLGLVVFK